MLDGFSRTAFAAYWIFGAVLNVPFLAAGEVMLLFDRAWVRWACWLVLVFLDRVHDRGRLGCRRLVDGARCERCPSGKDVFGDATPAHRLPQLVSIPSYVLLLAGTLYSAWRMRGRPELRVAVRRHAADRARRHGRRRRVGVRGDRRRSPASPSRSSPGSA